tara:strand:- start:352 stop:1089 length:738 start_codon:yes stop_codon:yes gene_type:complete
MAFGVRAFNESGYTQIDETYGNLQVVANGTTGAMGTNTLLTTPLPSGVGSDAVVFIRPTANTGVGAGNFIIFWGYLDFSANTFVIGRPLAFSFYQGTYDYIVCVPNLTPPTSGYGLNVFTSGGDLAYSSEYNSVECVEAVNFSLSSFNDSFNFTENNAGWASGDNVYDFYVLLNAMGKVGRVAGNSTTHYYRASAATYKYTGGTNPDAQNIKIGASELVAPSSSGAATTVFSTDSRCQVFAKYGG